MSQRIRHRILYSLLLLGVLALCAGLTWAWMPRASHETRTFVLIAEGMAFHLEGSTAPNPMISVEAGEDVRLVLVQKDAGYEHDLALPALGLATEILSRPGERAVLHFRAPSAPGDYEYLCTLHPTLMRGVLRVR